MEKGMKNEIGIYVHVPFCVRKCSYCDFYSVAGTGEEGRERYVKAVCGEIAAKARGEGVSTVYFGGGTPSLLAPAQADRILSEVGRGFRLAPGAEISMEANPETVDAGKLASFRAAGVNRLSIGVQSFSDRLLSSLGRIHDSARAVKAVGEAREAGFDNIGVDLMFGLPGQAVEDWRGDLRRAFELPVVHLSAYELTVEEDTPFGRNPPPLPGEDEAVAMWETTLKETMRAGFGRYEVSNYAKPGRECRHNLNYWRDGEYLGFGAAAWSSRGGVRTGNPAEIGKYMEGEARGFPPAVTDAPEGRKKMAETLMLNLRMTAGCAEAEFDARYGQGALESFHPVLERPVVDGFLENKGGFLRFTPKGMMVANDIWADIIGFSGPVCGGSGAGAILF